MSENIMYKELNWINCNIIGNSIAYNNVKHFFNLQSYAIIGMQQMCHQLIPVFLILLGVKFYCFENKGESLLLALECFFVYFKKKLMGIKILYFYLYSFIQMPTIIRVSHFCFLLLD